MRIGVLTGGGDCPGLNAVIRAVVRKGVEVYGDEFVGFRDGWRGPLEGDVMPLDVAAVRGILPLGGTILGSSRTNPYSTTDGERRVLDTVTRLGIEGLVVIGGEDTLGVATKLAAPGLPVVGVPKTIDNDLGATDYTFGFDTAVMIATEAIDRLHTTAESHHRVLIVEVMGRHAGWIAWHCRRRRRRQRDPDPRAPVRHRQCVRVHRAPVRQPLCTHRGGGRGGTPRRGHAARTAAARSTRSATSVSPASGPCWSPRSPDGPARRPAPRCSATSSAVAAPPPSTGCWPPGSGSTPSTPCTAATPARWWRCTGPTSTSYLCPRRRPKLKLVVPELYAEAEVFFG